MMAAVVLCAYLGISIAAVAIECVDEQCAPDPMKSDPMKSGLLSWYDEWKRGFQVDYITINELRDSYDFIVVGAGIGGSIVAHRLAMDPSYPKVLLLEAGGKHNTSGLSQQMIPIQVADNQLTNIDWAYQSEPSDGYCCEWNKEGRHQMPRGKVSGGTAVLNYMMWVRGHREDWDVLFNIDEWKWNDVLPYFKKTESVHSYGKCSDLTTYRGCDGPIIINDARGFNANKNSIFDEFVLNGYINTKKFKFLENGQNNGDNVGVAYSEFNIDDTGHRNTAFLGYNKYLRSKYKKEYEDGLINLDILTDAHVIKILIEDIDNNNNDLIRAKGVEFADLNNDKKLYTVYLNDNKKGEVILGGGTINNPQLLMLSGLGPKDELNKHNIKVIRDIPGIGNNLQEHPMSYMRYHVDPKYQVEVATPDKVERILNNFTLFKDYLFEGRSVLSTSGGNINAFIRSQVMNEKYGTKETYPDLQFYFIPGFGALEEPLNKKNDVMIKYECGKPEYLMDKTNVMDILTAVGLQHPESRGWIKLKSSDPFDHPLIQPNFLKEQFDVDSLMEGHKIMNNVMSQPSIKKLWDEKMECKKYGDNLEQYIRDSINNIFHPVGTCKMGDIVNDKMAVIDNKLLVRGTLNLRIVDASIYPHQTSGNPQAPTSMVGEKASHIILKKWNS